MNPEELPLRDIHFPDAVSWWPPAIGWWLLLILIPLLLFACYRLFKRITRKTAVKMAKKQLLTLKQNQNLGTRQKLDEISALIRRVAISINPRSECASLTGKAWLEYLDKSLNEKLFSKGIGQILVSAKYQKNLPDNFNLDELITLTERWLKTQK